jgi:uracil-DNA glycosylase family 4
MKKIVKFLKEEIDEDTYIPPSYYTSSKTLPEIKNTDLNMSEMTKGERLLKLEKEVANCRKCPLGFSRIKAVFGVGSPDAKVMFVGEGPGWEEDHRGEPFVGKAGQLLDKILASINLDRTKVYIANVVKCHPMINPQTPDARGNDRPPTNKEISACRFYLEEQIRIIKPLCIVTLGNTATKFILNSDDGVSKLRGKIYEIGKSFFFDFDIKVIPTYHPAALLRNPSLKKETWQDMKMLRDFLKDK